MSQLEEVISNEFASATGHSSGDSAQERDFRSEASSRTESGPESIRVPEIKHLPGDVVKNLCYGANLNCSMSLIRKYLCLFVFLDSAVHLLIYLQYLKHEQEYDLMDLIQCQMKCYDIQNSFIDILMLSFGRFFILESFYGVARSDSWAGTALTTALTSVFLIVKPLHYDWENECQRMWPVSLMILSFTLAWLEAFLVDFRLIGMERLARKFADVRPETFKTDLPKISFFAAFFPITGGLLRSIFVRSDSMTLFQARTDYQNN